jgi:NitT/TauT family transport system substrate-binding protein
LQFESVPYIVALMKVSAAATVFAIAFLLCGCNRQSASPTVATVSEVRLGYFPNLTHGQAVLGVSSGEFAAAVAPAKFTPRQFNAGPSLIEALLADQIDIGYVGPGPAINGFVQSHGQGLVVVAGAANNGVLIVARKDAGINSLADLAGKKIATPQHGNTQDIAARHYLSTTLKQTDLSNVRPIPNADQAAAFARGDIDAAWVPEPWGSLLISTTGAKLVGEEKDLWPEKEFSLTVIVTTPAFLAAHPDIVEKILVVHRSWTKRLNAETGNYVQPLEDALFAMTSKRLPPGVTASALERVEFTDLASDETFEANAQWAYDLGLAKEKPDLNGLTDLTILHKLQAVQ